MTPEDRALRDMRRWRAIAAERTRDAARLQKERDDLLHLFRFMFAPGFVVRTVSRRQDSPCAPKRRVTGISITPTGHGKISVWTPDD